MAAESDWLIENSFTSSHCYRIVRAGNEWKEKLEWITQNYQDVLKPLGFNGSHVAQIVIGAGWDKKLDWIKENYQEYQQYSFTPARIARVFNAENWQDMITHWYDALPVFPVLHITDDAISPLTEQYLARLLMQGTSASEVIMLKEKCTEEALNTFKDNVGNLVGIEKEAADAKKIGTILCQKYGYNELEIKMYITAMNKNTRGLVTWYNTGKMYSAREIPLDDRTAAEAEILPEEEYGRKEMMEIFIQKSAVLKTDPIFWRRFLEDYNGDVELLNQEERNTFNNEVQRIRENQPLMAELYDLLKP